MRAAELLLHSRLASACPKHAHCKTARRRRRPRGRTRNQRNLHSGGAQRGGRVGRRGGRGIWPKPGEGLVTFKRFGLPSEFSYRRRNTGIPSRAPWPVRRIRGTAIRSKLERSGTATARRPKVSPSIEGHRFRSERIRRRRTGICHTVCRLSILVSITAGLRQKSISPLRIRSRKGTWSYVSNCVTSNNIWREFRWRQVCGRSQ